MKNCVIVSVVCIVIGSFNGLFVFISVIDLGVIVIKVVIECVKIDL